MSSAARPLRPHTIVPAHPGFSIRFIWYGDHGVELSNPEPVIAWLVEPSPSPHGDTIVSVSAITPSGTNDQRCLVVFPDGQAELPEDAIFNSVDDALQELRAQWEKDRGRPTTGSAGSE